MVAGLAAGSADAQSLRIIPGIVVSETYSDNVALGPSAAARRGWITDISPGIRLDLEGARAKGFLDLRIHDLRYSSEPGLDNTQGTLYSRMNLEAVENWLFIDARADLNRQNLSAFDAAVTPDQPTASRNRVEVATLQVAPFIRGRLSDVATYMVRYGAAEVRTDEDGLPDTGTGEFSARIQSASPSAKFGWAVDGTDLTLDNDLAGSRRDSRVRATLIYAAAPSLQLSVSEGYENSDFGSAQDDGLGTPGVGLTWTPSGRTQVAALFERRYFGNGHNVLFAHRTPRTAWRIASVKDAAVLPAGVAAGSAGSITGLMSFLLTSAIPDPDDRAAAVRGRIEEWGLAEHSLIGSGVVNLAPYVYRNSEASVTVLGARNTVTLSYVDREELHSATEGAGDGRFAENFRQRGFATNWSRRITPLTALTASAASLRTRGVSGETPDTRQAEFRLALSSRLGPNTTVSLGVRRVNFRSSEPATDYRENAVFVTFSVRT